MFNKRFATVMTTIHAWMIAISAVLWTIYSIWEASGYYDFAEALGAFAALMIAGFIYLSIWYLAIYLIRKAVLK